MVAVLLERRKVFFLHTAAGIGANKQAVHHRPKLLYRHRA